MKNEKSNYFENRKTISFSVLQKPKLYFCFRISIHQKNRNGILGTQIHDFIYHLA